jgi:hypothetical protein
MLMKSKAGSSCLLLLHLPGGLLSLAAAAAAAAAAVATLHFDHGTLLPLPLLLPSAAAMPAMCWSCHSIAMHLRV